MREQSEAGSMKCEQKERCDLPPMARVYWPGDKARILCMANAIQMQEIAQAIDLYVVIEPLS